MQAATSWPAPRSDCRRADGLPVVVSHALHQLPLRGLQPLLLRLPLPPRLAGHGGVESTRHWGGGNRGGGYRGRESRWDRWLAAGSILVLSCCEMDERSLRISFWVGNIRPALIVYYLAQHALHHVVWGERTWDATFLQTIHSLGDPGNLTGVTFFWPNQTTHSLFWKPTHARPHTPVGGGGTHHPKPSQNQPKTIGKKSNSIQIHPHGEGFSGPNPSNHSRTLLQGEGSHVR